MIAEWIDRIVTDAALNSYLKTQQKQRLKELGYEVVAQKYRENITRFIEGMK